MPTGKVKWFDAEKGFGFLSQESGPDVYVRSEALPEGTTTVKAGTRVEFGIAQGQRGEQALQVRIIDAPASVSRNQRDARRKSPEDMVSIVEDLIQVLDGIGDGYRHGRHPDGRTAKPVAAALRGLADELELRLDSCRSGSIRRADPSRVARTQHPRRPRGEHHCRHAQAQSRRVERHRDPDEPADHPRQLEGGVAAREGAGLDPVGDVALDGRVEGELRQRLPQPGDQAEQREREHAVEHRGEARRPRRRPAGRRTP